MKVPVYDKLFLLLGGCVPKEFICTLDMPLEMAARLLRSEERADVVRARWKTGRARPGEIAYVMESMSYLLGDRVRNLWRDRGFTGWSTIPCDLVGRGGAAIAGYEFLVVAGRCGRLDRSRSATRVEKLRFGTYHHRRGLFFEGDRWDGSEVFMADNYGAVFVTERVVEATREFAPNVAFQALDSFEFIDVPPEPEPMPGRITHRRVLH